MAIICLPSTISGLPDLTLGRMVLDLQLPGTPSAPGRRVSVVIEAAAWAGAAPRWTAEARDPDGAALQLELSRQANDWTVAVTSRSAAWTLGTIRGPELRLAPGSGLGLLWPDGLGRRFPDLASIGTIEAIYPSGRCTMAWCAFARATAGWYLGCHDPQHGRADLRAETDGEGTGITWTLHPWLAPGQSWTSPVLCIQAYSGRWTTPARLYRGWADTWFTRRQIPAWVAQQTGWMLAILKQQNGQVLWSYHDLPKVWAMAKAHGLSAVGLFGWAHGGHDRLYPDYHPDPAMGGEAVLRQALAEARQQGLRVILYANGLLMDTATDFYRWHGNDCCAWRDNHEPYVNSIRKFDSCTPVTFAHGCSGSARWREQLRQLAEQACDLGADGLLYDQIGVYPPMECHHPGHGHARPSAGLAEERFTVFADIAASMRQRDAEFVLMTEGVVDALGVDFAWFHGWGTGFAAKPLYNFLQGAGEDFPGLFRTAFPELPLLQRFSSPTLGRAEANHALLHGLMHELEARWPADVAYLERGEPPAADAYADCTYYPPDAELMRATPIAESRSYLAGICAFARDHTDLLRQGRYDGDDGIAGVAALPATAWRGALRRGVMVLNPGDAPVIIDPSLDGVRPTSAVEPLLGIVDPASPLPARSLRLYLFAGDGHGR